MANTINEKEYIIVKLQNTRDKRAKLLAWVRERTIVKEAVIILETNYSVAIRGIKKQWMYGFRGKKKKIPYPKNHLSRKIGKKTFSDVQEF